MTYYRPPSQSTGAKRYVDKAKTDAVSAISGKQLVYIGATVNNRAAASNIVGMTFKKDNSVWKAGQWDDSAGASYTDDTTDAQSGTSNSFALTSTTNDDGFIVQAKKEFGVVSIQVTTAEAGSSTYEYTYWNGSAWSALTNIEAPDFTGTGETTWAFAAPTDWTALASGDTPVDTDGLTAGYYAIRMRATTTPTTAPLASQLWVAEFYDFKEDASDNDPVNFNHDDVIMGLSLDGGDSITPYFKTKHNDNAVSVRYYVKG